MKKSSRKQSTNNFPPLASDSPLNPVPLTSLVLLLSGQEQPEGERAVSRTPTQPSGRHNRSKNKPGLSANTPEQPSLPSPCQPASQEEAVLPSKFIDTWMEKISRYMQEESVHLEEEVLREKLKGYAKHEVVQFLEILPAFKEAYAEFALIYSRRRATEEAVQEYRRWLKRYQGPVRVLTETKSPLPEEQKTQLKETLAKYSSPHKLKEMLLIAIREDSWEKEGISVLDRNINKAPLKHPLWGKLLVHLFLTLKERGQSERQAYKIIARFFRVVLSHQWFDLRHAEDTIRLNVQRRLKALEQDEAV